METLLIVGKVIFGGYFLIMGLMHFKNLKMMTGYATSKGVPSPALAVGGSGLMILLGGAGIILNTYIGPALLLVAIFLTFVSLKMHAFWKETDPNAKMSEMTNFLKNMALLGATVALYALLTS